jgi:predicted nucleotidyltransferase
MVPDDRRVTRRWSQEQLDRLRAAAPSLLRRLPEVVSAWLYGSALRPGEVGDLDIALFVRPGDTLSMGDLGRLGRWLQEASGPQSPELDLRIMRERGAALAHQVRRTGLLLYGADPAERAWVEARIEGIYLDEGWLRRQAQTLLGGTPDAA